MTDGLLCAAFAMMLLGPTLLGLGFNLERKHGRAGRRRAQSANGQKWILHPQSRDPLARVQVL